MFMCVKQGMSNDDNFRPPTEKLAEKDRDELLEDAVAYILGHVPSEEELNFFRAGNGIWAYVQKFDKEGNRYE